MAIANLSAIITKVRQLSSSGNSYQITDSQIIDLINSYYLYDFPAEFRSLKLKDMYTFNTIKGIDTYPFDSEHFSTIEAPAYCMNREIKLFQDSPWSFFAVNYNWQFQQNIATGDGTPGPYTAIAQSTPIIRSTNNNPMVSTQTSQTTNFLTNPQKPTFPQTNISRVQNILITANTALGQTLNVTDDGNGNLIGDVDTSVPSTIDYDSGAISVKFSASIPSGENIQLQYNPQQLSIPLSILFYQNQFTLRPVPDKGYTISLVAYRLPSQVLMGTTSNTAPNLNGQPEQNEWWETIAFGVAKKIYQNRLDTDGVAIMDAFLKEAISKNQTRTYAQLGKQRIQTLFSDQLQYNYGSSGWGFGNTP